MGKNSNMGKVIIAGAGPGDPELITLKTIRFLRKADAVFTDRLVSEEILNRYVNPAAEIIYVGKQCRHGSSTPQNLINELLVEYALSGKFVVRLKGGDVSIFSNILDELQELVKHGISYEIVPGITAASGAAAYSGIPLTARGYSSAVRILTYHRSNTIRDSSWKELAQTDDTLVFYMSSENLDILVSNLLKNNIDHGKLIAVVEQATTPMQNVTISSFHDYDLQLKGKTFVSPSLLIIGKVVELHDQFAWLNNDRSGKSYFIPVSNKKIINTKVVQNVG